MIKDGETYSIVNMATMTILDENKENNWWLLERAGPLGGWTIKNIATGNFLTYDGMGQGSPLKGSDVPHECDVKSEMGDSIVRLHPAGISNLLIDIQGGNPDDDAKIVLESKAAATLIGNFSKAPKRKPPTKTKRD